MSDELHFPFLTDSTYAGRYLAMVVRGQDRPVVTRYWLYISILKMYRSDAANSLYLRGSEPTYKKVKNLIDELVSSRTLSRIGSSQVFSVLGVSTSSVTDAVCLADDYCSVAYLSAMQRWGISERNPKTLLVHRPNGKLLHEMIDKKVQRDAKQFGLDVEQMVVRPVKSPSALYAGPWGSPIEIVQDKKERDITTLRGSSTRISTFSQTFIDTLTKPELCGGMAHVIDVWEEHIPAMTERNISELMRLLLEAPPIVKVRAGYLLEEKLGLSIEGIDQLSESAQRGGSRVLDPQKPFAATYSEKWMLSLNV